MTCKSIVMFLATNAHAVTCAFFIWRTHRVCNPGEHGTPLAITEPCRHQL
jgi:hypothetical protein